ncbi:MAG: DNA primase [Planctomycetaceae bacterium]|nr:DNA primase [Planctomycetaceae bacterium]
MNLQSAGDVKELVRSRTDIVALIGESLTLQPERGGRLFKGLCPFHDDHNPSFQVNPERQTYKCWSCTEGGDCFSFVMKYENIGFREALVMLARRAGVELPTFQRNFEGEKVEKTPLYDVLGWAANEFHHCLQHSLQGDRGRDYLRSRGFRGETIEKFRLGFHPDDGHWIEERNHGQFPTDLLLRANLIDNSEFGGGYYDRFVDRVMFPICDERGRTVAFGARVLPDTRHSQNAKYLNSAETPVFQKNRTIFALHHARDAIRKSGLAVVMEGYADCIKAHQAGVVNAVATLGTALTESQVTVLKRSARRVVLVYDGDGPGLDAARKAIEKFLAQDLDLRIVTLPNGFKDPDEYLDAHGVSALENLIEQAPEAWEHQLRYCQTQYGSSSIDGRMRTLDELLTLLTVVPGLPGTVRESALIARLAQRVAVSESDARRRLRELQQGRASGANRKLPAGDAAVADESAVRRQAVVSLQRNAKKDDLLETELLQILFTAPHTIEAVRREIGTDDIRNEPLRELLATAFDLWDHGESPDLNKLLAAVDCPHLKSLAVWIDEQATMRNIAGLLAQEAATSPEGRGSDGHESDSESAGLLRQVLSRLTWRRECDGQEIRRGRLASRPDVADGLDPELRDLLKQASSFHQQRAVRKLPS